MKIVNKTGYLKGTKTAKNPVNIIPSNLITTQGMAFPIKANGKTLYPNTGQYKFPTSHVVETPLKQKFQKGTLSISAKNKKQFADVANMKPKAPEKEGTLRQEMKKSFSTLNKPITFGQKPGSVGDKVGSVLNLGSSRPGQGYSITPTTTAKETALNYATGEVIGAAAKPVVKYVSPYIKQAGKYLKDKISPTKVIPKPTSLINKTENPLIYKDPNTGKTIYEIDPADYDNFSTPELKQQALKDLEIGKKNWYKYQNKEQQEVVKEAQRIITPKQPTLSQKDFYMNSEVRQISKNSKDFKNLEKEINRINPNLESEEDLSKIFLTRPDLEKRWYSMMEHGKDFNKKILSPSQQRYLDKQSGYISGTSRPNLMPAGSLSKEGIHPSPQDLRKVKFPINFGIGSMNKNGNKNVKNNLVKYKEGSKGVSLAFSRGEKDPKGGLTQKGVDKYNRATGGNLKMAVTTPPSKLKTGSKDANRRKSFCARMSGVKGPMTKPNGEPSRKALALRKWNC